VLGIASWQYKQRAAGVLPEPKRSEEFRAAENYQRMIRESVAELKKVGR
jgi:hypothetical protein